MFGMTNASAKKLIKRSKKALDIFQKTIDQLTKHNADVDAHIEAREVKISKIQLQTSDLKAIKDSNQKVINKINKIFE